jgi:hypothetical protein
MKKLYFSLIRSAIILFLVVFFSTETSFGQTLRINEDIGGNGTSSESSGDSENTFIYVAAAVVIGGLIAYALLKDDTKDKKEETDTTSVGSLLNGQLLTQQNSVLHRVLVEEKKVLPVDLFFGVRNEDALMPEKTYLAGLSVMF